MQKLNVTFLLDRAGLVGKDGETHQGAFDLSFMNAIPNMTILAPKDGDEFRAMLEYSLTFQGPLAIRYPRGACGEASAAVSPITYGNAALLAAPKIDAEKQVTILSVGNMASEALKAKEILEENDIAVTIQNVRFVKPFDETMTEKAFRESDLVVTMEDGVKKGGFGESVAALFASKDSDFYRAKRVMNVGIPDTFVPHGTVAELYRFLKMDGESTARRIIAYFETV